MRVKVLFFGAVKDIVGRAEESVTVDEGVDIARLFDTYAARFPSLAPHAPSLLYSRNREFARTTERLSDGDEVAFLPPVSGGSPESDSSAASAPPLSVCRLTRSAIDTAALAREMKRSRDGAVVIFEGIVRDHTGDRQTLYLEYEAYEPMALEKMREIGGEVRRKFPVDGVGMIHRLGRMEIGETSVAIVVASEHRGPAFEACRYAIDRLKKIVPIWKKEFFAGGAVWVEGEGSERGCVEPAGKSVKVG